MINKTNFIDLCFLFYYFFGLYSLSSPDIRFCFPLHDKLGCSQIFFFLGEGLYCHRLPSWTTFVAFHTFCMVVFLLSFILVSSDFLFYFIIDPFAGFFVAYFSLQLFTLCLFPSIVDLSFHIAVVKKDTWSNFYSHISWGLFMICYVVCPWECSTCTRKKCVFWFHM